MGTLKKLLTGTILAALAVTSFVPTALAGEVGMDLTVQDIYVDEVYGYLTVEVANIGTEHLESEQEGYTYIYIDEMDNPAWAYSWEYLADKDFYDYAQTSLIQPQVLEGAHTVKACVDASNDLEEVDEDNNCLTVELGEINYPDLTVSDIYLEEDTSYLTVEVSNVGTEHLESEQEGYTYIYIDDMDNPAWTYSWEHLDDKLFYDYGQISLIQPQVLEDAHTVKACVDASNDLEESDENNNCMTVSFAEEGLPDLVVRSISLDDGMLSFVVANGGETDVDVALDGGLYIYIDDMDNPDKTYSWDTLSDTGFLEANNSSTFQPMSLEGDHTVKVCLDPKENVEESNEGNNCLTLDLSEDGMPDLVVSDIYLDGSYLSVEVSNYGNADVDADANGHTYIYIDGVLEWTYSWDFLADKSFLEAGGSAVIQPQTFEGTHTVLACVDPNDVVDESSETDNCREVQLAVATPVENDNDSWLFRDSLMLLKLGDFDGHDMDWVHNYTGALLSNDTDLVEVDVVGTLLYENGDYFGDTYGEVPGEGVEYDVNIFNHWDGIVLYVHSESSDNSTERSLQLTVDGYVNETLKNKDDLELFEIGDDTDNYAKLMFLGYLDEETAETTIDNVAEMLDALSGYAEQMEEEEDEEVTNAFDGLVEAVLDTSVLSSDLATETLETALNNALEEVEEIDSEVLESALEALEEEEEELQEELYEEGINPFKDVGIKEWFGDYVKEMMDLGIISGYKDKLGNLTGEFKPANEVTVAEMLKIALEAAGVGTSSNTPSKGENHWSAGYVAMAEELEMMIVQDDGLDLDRPATRAEVMVMIAEAFGLEAPTYEESTFSDFAYAGDQYTGSVVEYMKDMEVIEGYGDGTFGYILEVNRAEVSKIVINVINIF